MNPLKVIEKTPYNRLMIIVEPWRVGVDQLITWVFTPHLEKVFPCKSLGLVSMIITILLHIC